MDDLKSLNELLNYVKTILDLKKKSIPKNTGFTVFSALRNEHDEDKTHTTFLYEILRPDGLHGIGDKFLRKFFETVLEQPYSSTAKIYQEYHIKADDNYGRPDLCIETSDNCYPIEIKIYARDQDCQIDRYIKFAKERSKTSKVYYLTLDGHTPSSCDKSKENDFVCISFAEQIRKWLINCVDVARDNKNVVDVLNQYITLLDKLTSSEQDDIYMDAIKKIITQSKENYECAATIEKALLAIRTSKIITVFNNIKEHLSNDIECDYNEKGLRNFYRERNPYSALAGKIKSSENIIVELVFEISVEGFYYGVAIDVQQGDLRSTIQKQKEFIKNLYNNNNWHNWADKISRHGWVWWKWLPSKNEQINFHNCSGENYLKLYDAAEFDRIMKAIYADIDSNLDYILKNGVPEDLVNLEHY
jgi:hypothetical protein